MNAPTRIPISPTSIQPGQPTWDVALLYPAQGEWTERDYLALETNRLVELSDGCLEFSPIPPLDHQLIVEFLYLALRAFLRGKGLGKVLFAPVRVRLWPGKIREPDLVFFRQERVLDLQQPLNGADLVIEVVSDDPTSRERDLETMRDEYARAGIAEYWIVDPQQQRITVLSRVPGGTYRVHGEFGIGSSADSPLLPGFAVDVAAALAAGQADS